MVDSVDLAVVSPEADILVADLGVVFRAIAKLDGRLDEVGRALVADPMVVLRLASEVAGGLVAGGGDDVPPGYGRR